MSHGKQLSVITFKYNIRGRHSLHYLFLLRFHFRMTITDMFPTFFSKSDNFFVLTANSKHSNHQFWQTTTRRTVRVRRG